MSFWRNPVYCSWSTNTPPPYFLFCYFLFLCSFQFRLGGQGQACPAGLGKRLCQGPAGLEPSAVARIRKKEKSEIRGEGYLCFKSKTWDSPAILALSYLKLLLICNFFSLNSNYKKLKIFYYFYKCRHTLNKKKIFYTQSISIYLSIYLIYLTYIKFKMKIFFQIFLIEYEIINNSQ